MEFVIGVENSRDTPPYRPQTMCRMMVFSGPCLCCGEYFRWNDLSQELACLEAKNNGIFGDCRRGIAMEEHSFEQECDACAEAGLADEGVGMDDDYRLEAQKVISHQSQVKERDRAREEKERKKSKRQRIF